MASAPAETPALVPPSASASASAASAASSGASPPASSRTAPSSTSSPPAAPPHAPHATPSQAGPPRALNSTLPSAAASRQIAEARAALVASLGNMLDSELQSRAAILHSNAGAIAAQQRDLGKATAALRRENDKMARVADDAARKVKELGNVQNWAELLEKDFLQLQETLRLVREGMSEDEDEDEDGSEWTGSQGRSRSGSLATERLGAADLSTGVPHGGPHEGAVGGDADIGVGSSPVPAPTVAEPVADKGKGRASVDAVEVDMPAAEPAAAGGYIPLATETTAQTATAADITAEHRQGGAKPAAGKL